MSLVVLKFGGTSVGDAQSIRHTARITQEATSQWNRVVVVTSAMGKSIHTRDNMKVTDALLVAARTAADGDSDTFHRIRRELTDKHQSAISAVVTNADDRMRIQDDVEQLLSGFEILCASVRVLGEVTPRALDAISGLGERMAVRILAGALRSQGVPAEPVDATELIVTNDHYQSAIPLMEATREKARARLLTLLEAGIVPVVTGFIAATASGVPTTLGRGGSDYSASIIGDVLEADEVHNYTDVDGVLTADPRIVPEARTINTLTGQEMSELAFFGAQVLHPMTIAPLLEKRIPLRVKNTFNPSHPGTLIVHENPRVDGASGNGIIKAVTVIDRVSMITVAGRGMKGVPGIAGRMFTAVARTNTSILMISQASAEQSICFVIPLASSARVVRELSAEFSKELSTVEIDRITTLDDAAIVTAVGMGIALTPGVSGKVCSAIGILGINISSIAQGSSECGISLVIHGADSREAVRAVHALTIPA
jgi:bifunctional aspartokinase / homoserine dehydrogenase 1